MASTVKIHIPAHCAMTSTFDYEGWRSARPERDVTHTVDGSVKDARAFVRSKYSERVSGYILDAAGKRHKL